MKWKGWKIIVTKYTLRDVANKLAASNENLSCTCSYKNNQIILQTKTFPEEVKHILSPYYQEKIKTEQFDDKDMRGVIIEARHFVVNGW